MKVECRIDRLAVIPEDDQDLAYLRDTIGVKDKIEVKMVESNGLHDSPRIEIKHTVEKDD